MVEPARSQDLVVEIGCLDDGCRVSGGFQNAPLAPRRIAMELMKINRLRRASFMASRMARAYRSMSPANLA